MDVEQRARELLAAQYRKAGANPAACELMAGRASWPNQMALNAIIAALTPPEGWILMPRVLTEEMLQAGYPADDAQTGYEAMLAARPEVKP